MADKKEQEPSIEEILSSIRQIISDDDEEVVDDFDDEDDFEPPLGLYDRGARGADQITKFFADAGLPLPELEP